MCIGVVRDAVGGGDRCQINACLPRNIRTYPVPSDCEIPRTIPRAAKLRGPPRTAKSHGQYHEQRSGKVELRSDEVGGGGGPLPDKVVMHVSQEIWDQRKDFIIGVSGFMCGKGGYKGCRWGNRCQTMWWCMSSEREMAEKEEVFDNWDEWV